MALNISKDFKENFQISFNFTGFYNISIDFREFIHNNWITELLQLKVLTKFFFILEYLKRFQGMSNRFQ